MFERIAHLTAREVGEYELYMRIADNYLKGACEPPLVRPRPAHALMRCGLEWMWRCVERQLQFFYSLSLTCFTHFIVPFSAYSPLFSSVRKTSTISSRTTLTFATRRPQSSTAIRSMLSSLSRLRTSMRRTLSAYVGSAASAAVRAA